MKSLQHATTPWSDPNLMRINPILPGTPQQQNNDDCGVFTSMSLETLSLGGVPHHQKEDCNNYRKHMILTIRQKKLHGTIQEQTDPRNRIKGVLHRRYRNILHKLPTHAFASMFIDDQKYTTSNS